MGEVLRGDRVVLRSATAADVPRFAEILAHADIAEWWVGYDESRVRHEVLDTPDITAFAIELEGQVIGFIEYHEETDPDYRSAGMDLALDAACLGQGLGTDALRTLARYLFGDRDHHRLTIDPAVANRRAIAAYEKVGFKPVGVMREYEKAADGVYRDGLLMDLLRDEFEG